jgi:cyclohexadieny/prephenate dehydrogenase
MKGAMFQRVALIGIGLIGSSISHALRRRALAGSIVGSAKTQATRATALRLGLVESAYASAAEAVEGADLVVLCLPVGACGHVARAIRPGIVEAGQDTAAPDFGRQQAKAGSAGGGTQS